MTHRTGAAHLHMSLAQLADLLPCEDASLAAAARYSRAAESSSATAAMQKRKRDSSTGTAAPSLTASAAAKRARRKRAKASSSVDFYAQTKCELCQGADHDEKILLCDECDQGFHIFCLSPPLAAIPATDWSDTPSTSAIEVNHWFGYWHR